MLWAHLEEECDEVLEIAIPAINKGGIKLNDEKRKAMAMELVDVQIMCNTIIASLGDYLLVDERMLNFKQQIKENYALQIINLMEQKTSAAMLYKDIIRKNKHTAKMEFRNRLCNVVIAAEALMSWILPDKKSRNETREKTFNKNNDRGYYG